MVEVTGGRSNKRNLVTSEAGSTSIEYATLFGVILVCLIVGVYCLGEISKSSFQTAATALHSGMSGTTNQSGDAPQQLKVAVAKNAPHKVSRWQIFALGAAFLLASLTPLSYIVWKSRSNKKKPHRESAEISNTPEAPAAEQQAFQKRQQIRRVFQNEMASLLEGHLKVRQIMSRQLTCVRKSETVQNVRDLMELKKIRFVIVSDKENRLIGIISENDCVSRKGKRAADIMTENPISLDVDCDLAPAITMLVSKRIACLPITNAGRLEGVVTTTDFLMTLQCALQTLGGVAEHLELAKRKAPITKTTRSSPAPIVPMESTVTPATYA